MNGFIIFKDGDAVDKFLASPRISELKSRPRLERASNDSLVIFRNLSADELPAVREFAVELGGEIRESVQYRPL